MPLFKTLLVLIWFWPGQPNPVPLSKHKFIVIAHRGDHVFFPENTIAAYRAAIKNNADYIEIDLRTTKDGKLISMHDGNVNRVTNGTGAVKDLLLADLLQLIVKSKDTTSTKKFSIPTFAGILKLCKNKINIYLDFKEADAATAYKMIKHYGMEKHVLVYINNDRQLKDWRTSAPQIPLMLSMPDSIKTVELMQRFIQFYKPDILDGDFKQYTNEMIKCARENNLPVWPDIQSFNEGATDWDKALKKGLTGLQSDHPAALISYLKSKKIR